jgi:hypothetical protein
VRCGLTSVRCVVGERLIKIHEVETSRVQNVDLEAWVTDLAGVRSAGLVN